MNKITLDDIIEHIGQPAKKQSGELLWQCPYCMDKGRDNLKYNLQKQVLYCFANDEHSKQILSEINKKKFADKIDVHIPQYLNKQSEYLSYMLKSNEYLLSNDKALAYLQKTRGINKDTVEKVSMGFDKDNNKWVIPIFADDLIIGFEYRAADFEYKKIWRKKDTKRCLAIIYGKEKVDTLYLVEGFLKGYVLLQYLLEKGITDFRICSCSHGVSSLYNCISEIKFSNFNKIKLMLDADKAGDEATEKILNKYPFFVDVRNFLFKTKCKDFDEWYIKIYLGNV